VNDPIPVASLSKAWVCDSSLVGIVASNPAGPWTSVSCECCQAEVSALRCSLVHNSPTQYAVSECDRED